MSEKRRDNRNRILLGGESQRQDGRYAYKYKDINGEKSGMSPKTLQYIMGHSDISVTLNTYTHLTFDDAKAEFDRVAEA